MKQKEVLEKIQAAEMILVGLGEEFDHTRVYGRNEAYCQAKDSLQESEAGFLIPALQRFYREDPAARDAEEKLEKALENLVHALENKNYFVVSTSVNGRIRTMPWKEGRLVMPCGSELQKQCADGCAKGLGPVTDSELAALRTALDERLRNPSAEREADFGLGLCPECGKPLQLNNIYHAKYDENGYLEDWQRYTKWLQGTLNRRILILELGVGMAFPSVIRWPFEKVAFFNQKASFYRVNENLYQMTEELAGKGTAIPENVIDWLENLC